jgi:hypothetical protein
VSRKFVGLLGVAHLAVFFWLVSDWDRDRLLVFRTFEVTSEADINLPPADLKQFSYTQDDPAQLAEFREPALAATAGVTDDAQKFQRLADYIYGLRKPGARLIGEREYAYRLTALYDKLKAGEWGNCGHMVWMMTALTRSLGYSSRQVVWFTPDGAASHSAIEIFSQQYGPHGRWVYYDLNMNGLGVGRDGSPLSIATLRSNLLTGEDFRFVSHATLRDWDQETFIRRIRAYPLDWYLMNNRLLYYEKGTRFGRFRNWYDSLSKLPYPADRVMDNLFGARETRLAIIGQIGRGDYLTLRGLNASFFYLLTASCVCAVVFWLDGRRSRAKKPKAPAKT